ncbi:hypothetical protein FRC08_013672 [Ceratobasidium sp. 394]|nr:hypothetical protein FRC08_013672 [Ceratobasidium sp. 394]KAG9095853.1 hypothetical protein FS749_009654 [Ceratobasidium sp. UAMH 11750]
MGYYDKRPTWYAREYKGTGQRVGLGFVGLAGLSSAVSTLLLLAYITRYTFFSRSETPIARGIRSFARSPLGAFLYSLLLSDLVQGAAFSINFKWASDGSIRHSAACTAGGAISQVGDLGAAVWSLAIAYHTFSLLFLLKKPSIWTTRIMLGLGWTVILVLPILGPHVFQDVEKRGYFYGLVGAWCWIGPGYQLAWFLYLYVWIFLSLASSIVIYGLLYLRLSGRLSLEGGKLVWKTSGGQSRGLNCISSAWAQETSTSFSESNASGTRPPADPNRVGKNLKRIAKRLMLYPLAYSIVTIPIAILRLGSTAGWKPPFPYIIFAGVMFASSGLTNVLLFIATRHSFIQQVAAARPRIHISTHQVTVSVDAQGVQMVHLHEGSNISRPEEQDGVSEKVDSERDGSFILKQRVPDPEGDVGTPTVGVRFATMQ